MKNIGMGAIAVIVIAIAVIFLPAVDAVMRHQGMREIEELCEKVVTRSAQDATYARPDVRKTLEDRADSIVVAREDGRTVETWVFKIGIFPWGEKHRARIRIAYDDADRVSDLVPSYPEDLR